MPNWCGNQTTVSGPSEDLDDFFQRISNPAAFSTDTESAIEMNTGQQPVEIFSRLLPMPENGHKHIIVNEGADNEQRCSVFAKPSDGDEGEFIDGYAWCCDNWGTKWGDCETDFELFPALNNMVLTYNTAWGPAFSGWINVSKLFPRLSFLTTYEEEGEGICGAFSVVNGEVLYDGFARDGDDRYPTQDSTIHDRDDGGDAYFAWLDKVYELRDQMAAEAEDAVVSFYGATAQ